MVKISALPLDTSPTMSDYVPDVDAETLTTRRNTYSAIAALLFTQTNIPAGGGSPVTREDEGHSDYVASGGVWSGDSYGVNRNASMTTMVLYINGRRISIIAETARAFTASKDTYIDVLDNADGTGTLVYTEVTNNAASPTLAANSLRVGTVVTGASSIAASTSIGQGGFANTLPVISSQILRGFDSLGNIIYPKGPVSSKLTQNPYKFSVYRNAALTPAGTAKVTFDTKEYDTGNNVDVVTNNRFTAPIAGFYHFNAQITVNGAARGLIMLYKNGAEFKRGTDFNGGAGGTSSVISTDVQAAAGDYFEIFCNTGSAALVVGSSAFNYFQGSLMSAS